MTEVIDVDRDYQIICQNERCNVYGKVFIIDEEPIGYCLTCEKRAKVIYPKNRDSN